MWTSGASPVTTVSGNREKPRDLAGPQRITGFLVAIAVVIDVTTMKRGLRRLAQLNGILRGWALLGFRLRGAVGLVGLHGVNGISAANR